MSLTVVPVTLEYANAFVECLHRTHKRATGMKFALGVCDSDGVMRGVAIAGRANARALDTPLIGPVVDLGHMAELTAEVTRTCTDGYPNANSALYGAAWRVCTAMGYRKLITYNEEGESGVSLRAAGFVKVRDLPARKSWAESSVALKAMRDPIGTGGVARARWERVS